MKSIEIILCSECGKAFRIPEGKEVPHGTKWEEGEWGKECIKKGHRMAVLTVLPDSFVSDKPSIEVDKIAYFYAEDEKGKKYVIKQSREALAGGYHYEGFEGKIRTEVDFLGVQRDAIARQLQAEAVKVGIVVNDNYIDLIVAYLDNQISYDRHLRWLTPNQIIISDEHPLMIMVSLSSWMAESLCRFCQQFFPEKHRQFIKDFIEREKGEDGVLAFVGRRKFEIIHY